MSKIYYVLDRLKMIWKLNKRTNNEENEPLLNLIHFYKYECTNNALNLLTDDGDLSHRTYVDVALVDMKCRIVDRSPMIAFISEKMNNIPIVNFLRYIVMYFLNSCHDYNAIRKR